MRAQELGMPRRHKTESLPQDGVRTMKALVVESLRREILDGQLEPGHKLQQDALARRFGISIGPVREALNELQAEGLVTIEPHRGARVARLSRKELDELYAIFTELEGLAGRLASTRLSERDLAQLERLVARMDRAQGTGTGNLARWLEANEAFHLTIYRSTGNDLLADVLANFLRRSMIYVRRYQMLPRRAEVARQQHLAIIGACRARDAARLAQLMQQHILSTADAVRSAYLAGEE